MTRLERGFADPLTWLLGDQAGTFLSDVYEKAAVAVHHGDPDRYRDLLSLAEIDRVVSEIDLQRGMLTMANAANRIEESDFVMDTGAIDRAAVARLYDEGGTIILNQLQQSYTPLAGLCRALEMVFSCHFQTNTYLTPPSSQGFHTHFDNHDVFVIQIEGEKTWRLYDRPVDAPYRGEEFTPNTYPVGEPVQTFVLRAGDCAYVPRGLMHDAATSGDRPSLHITCGLILRTWADLMLEAVSEVCVKDPAFRRGLPPGFARPDFDRDSVQPEFTALLRRLVDQAGPKSALDLAITEFIGTREPDVTGVITRAHAPPADRYVARPSLWRIEKGAVDGEAAVHLIAPGGEMSFTGLSRDALERALSGQAFSPADLGPAGDKVVRRLVTAGLVTAT